MMGVGLVAREPWLVALGAAAPVGYAALNMGASLHSASARPRATAREAAWLPAVFATMHGSWGAGFLRGGAGG